MRGCEEDLDLWTSQLYLYSLEQASNYGAILPTEGEERMRMGAQILSPTTSALKNKLQMICKKYILLLCGIPESRGILRKCRGRGMLTLEKAVPGSY